MIQREPTLGQRFSGQAEQVELELGVREFGYGWSDIEWLTLNAMKSAFAPFDERLQLINTVIKPGFATARATSSFQVPPDLR
jgi:adenosine deaminase